MFVQNRADRINYSMVFSPPEENLWDTDPELYDKELAEWREAQDWLDQFYDCRLQCATTGRKHLLIVGTESYVEEVWSMKNNHYRGVCYLEWKRPNSEELSE
jgi:hypothetical protein